MEASMTEQELRGALSVNAFCETYGIGRGMFYKLLAAGKLHAVKVGCKTLVARKDAEAWFNALPSAKPAEIVS
jgi:excisionase family DNA binding protein